MPHQRRKPELSGALIDIGEKSDLANLVDAVAHLVRRTTRPLSTSDATETASEGYPPPGSGAGEKDRRARKGGAGLADLSNFLYFYPS